MASKFQFITELYSRTLTKLTGDYESWTGFLRAACYNYKCPFDEQVLIYAQRPNATAVLELEKWNKQFGRWVNTGATGIAVIDEAYGKGRLKHYFDIADTHTTPVSRPVPIWSMESAYTERVIETLEATFGTLAEKDNLPDAILSASRNAAADNMPDYLRDLLDCRRGSMLEELDALNVEVTYRRALECSVAYMMMTRLSLPAAAYILPEDFEGIYSFDTPGTINALGIATSDIAEMGLREISRTVMQARREQFFAKDAQIDYDVGKGQNSGETERSVEHGSDIQDAGGLSPAEPAAAPRAGDALGQVCGAAEAVHQEAPQGVIYESQDQRSAGGTSGGDRGDSAADGDAGRGADGESRGRDGGTESRRSTALDGADEQPEAQRGGSGAERSDLQLISEEPARAGSDALPALADNRANLYHVAAYHHFENGFDDKLDYPTLEEAEAAAQGYVAGTMEADGFAYDGAAVYDADANVCLRVYGDYPDEKAQAQAAIYAVEHDREAELPAFLDEHLIEAILLDDGGRKHTRQEIFAFFQTNRDIATRTEFLKSSYNDIWVEVLAGADKVRVGYHAEKDGLLMWEGSYLSRTAESVFSWGVVTEMTENLIERGAYKIKLGLQNAPVMAEQMSLFGMGGGTAVYEVPETQRTGELFPTRPVPQAVIDQTLYTAGNSRGSAERIAVFFMRQRPEAECIAFLRREFGTENGRGIEYEGKKYAVWFMEDGIHLAQGDSVRTGHSRTTVTWEQASARILELLEAGTYLSASELERAQDKVLLEMGDALLMTARDLAQEGRAQGLFPQTLAIHDQHKGYPELDEDMVAFAKSEGGLAVLAEEYHDFLRAYEQNRSIMRFRLSEYNTHRIGVVLDGIDLPERSFTAQPDFLRRCKMFITQDEIDQFFLADSVDSRLDVYAFFCYPHAKEKQQKFIKSRFGEYSGGGRDGYDYHNIALKPSEYQKEMVASLAERAEQVRNKQVDSSVDNMLLITNDGRKLALDQRLINPMLPADPESKAVKCAETVFDIWRRTAEKHSTQMIFCDLSTPKSEGIFSVYDDIRSKLVEMGVPENEIAYIHDAKTEAQKKDLFAKVRAGQVRVLLGSTQRMGAGTNCQQKLVALHHLDCPWRPADLQQREGRIIRQGNENAEVDIYSYVTEGTFDAYLYQLVERKQKFIAQIMTSKSPVRSAEDVDDQALSYAEIKALASGNPLIKEKMDLDIEVTKLKLLKSSHLSQRYSMEDAISKTFPKSIAETQERLAGYGADIAAVKAHTAPNEDGFSPMTLAGKVYTEKKAAGAELLVLCQNMLTPEAMQIGSYRGLTLELSFDSFSQEYRLTMIGQLRHVVTLGTDVFGNIQRMDNLLESLPLKEQACREKLSDLHNQLETARVEVLKPFPREEELQAKLARLEELNALLNMDKREPEVVAETEAPDNSQQSPTRKTTELER